MALRATAARPLKRPTLATRQRSARPGLSKSRKNRLIQELKPQGGINTFSRALRYLAGLSDYERLRIVRYTSQNFDLERMRLLLKRLGNPQAQFKSVHVAGPKRKGCTSGIVECKREGTG